MEKKLKEIVKQWILKAENDLNVIEHEVKVSDPTTDMICFHAQQCVEKYLKAFLIANQINYQHTHNIGTILKPCKDINPNFSQLTDSLILTNYAVDLRYADDFYIPEIEEAKEAHQIALKVKEFVLKELNKLM